MRLTREQVEAHQAKFGPRVQPSKGSAVERESDLHELIFAECRRGGWIVLHGSMSERTSRTLGEPDFVILADAGRTILIECKSRTGKLSTDQQAMAYHAAKLGHTVYCIRDFATFLDIVKNKS